MVITNMMPCLTQQSVIYKVFFLLALQIDNKVNKAESVASGKNSIWHTDDATRHLLARVK